MYYHHGNVSLHTVGTYTDKKPKMSQLLCMEYRNEEDKEDEIRILDQVTAKWEDLVLALDLPDVFIANEKAKPGWTPHNACCNAFSTWLNGEGAEPLTWATVLKALKRVGGCQKLIKQVELALPVEYGEVTQASEKKSTHTPDTTKGKNLYHCYVLSPSRTTMKCGQGCNDPQAVRGHVTSDSAHIDSKMLRNTKYKIMY